MSASMNPSSTPLIANTMKRTNLSIDCIWKWVRRPLMVIPRRPESFSCWNNPMFTDDSVPEDHQLYFDGWPLAGLHPSVRAGFREWYNGPSRNLLQKLGPHEVSRRVAIVQVKPWASRRFDRRRSLPSRDLQVAIVRRAANRGALVVIGRSIRFWRDHLGYRDNVYQVKWRFSARIASNHLGINSSEFADHFEACFTSSG
jgi:hypothetical protein